MLCREELSEEVTLDQNLECSARRSCVPAGGTCCGRGRRLCKGVEAFLGSTLGIVSEVGASRSDLGAGYWQGMCVCFSGSHLSFAMVVPCLSQDHRM